MALIETVTFRLAAGVERAAFFEADALVQQRFFYLQPGLLRRTVARSDDDTWIAVVLWYSAADADASMEAARRDVAAQAFDALIDRTTIRRARYETLE
jgi:hypothetical protein